jgi:hypothetical protein
MNARKQCVCGVVFGLVVVLSLGMAVSASAATMTLTETFDTDLGKFDVAVNNAANYNDFGWSNSNTAGGTAAGQLGGTYGQNQNGYVADRTLGGTLGWSDPLIIKSKMTTDSNGNDQTATLGYFTYTGNASDGVRTNLMAGVGFVAGGPRAFLLLDGVLSNTINIEQDVSHNIDLALSYNSLTSTATWSGTIAGQVVSVSKVVANPLRTANAFGSTSGYANETTYQSHVYFDDVQYTVYVPEPSAIALVTTGLLGLLAYAWRKRK